MSARRDKKPMPMIRLEPAYLGYVAGILDGEGSIRLRYAQGQFAVEVHVTNTCRRLLGWLQTRLGGFVVDHRSASAVHKRTWRWIVSARGARAVLEATCQYMLVKRRHAEIIGSFYAAIPEYKERYPGGLRLPLDQPLASLYAELRALNHRGPPTTSTTCTPS